MSAAKVEPHDKMRSRDVAKVARGEQAPRPAHEYGHTNQAPTKPSTQKDDEEEDENKYFEEPGTAPNDVRFPVMNQTRHYYTRYLEFHRLKDYDFGDHAISMKTRNTSSLMRTFG